MIRAGRGEGMDVIPLDKNIQYELINCSACIETIYTLV